MDAHHWTGDDDRDSRPEDRPDPIWLVCASCDGAEEFDTIRAGIETDWRRQTVKKGVQAWRCPLCAETRGVWGDK